MHWIRRGDALVYLCASLPRYDETNMSTVAIVSQGTRYSLLISPAFWVCICAILQVAVLVPKCIDTWYVSDESSSRMKYHPSVGKGPAFSRLTEAGRAFLLQEGFQLITDDSSLPSCLEFAWPAKTGPQYQLSNPTVRVRPFPTSVTDILDDKIWFSELCGDGETVPFHVSDPTLLADNDDRRYFVKHRHGVQGKSVRVFESRSSLVDWWETCTNRHDFCVQPEVIPTLWQGRKFVLRAHVLLVMLDCQPRAYWHRSVICQHHAVDYHDNHKLAAVSHNGSRGLKKHLKPLLVSDLTPSHPAHKVTIAKVSQRVASCFFASTWTQEKMCPGITYFALLGLDLLQRASDGCLVCCEVNSHPALGWGTMAKVPSAVYQGLVQDTLSVLLLPDRPHPQYTALELN